MRSLIRFSGILLLAITLCIVITPKSETPTAYAAPPFCDGVSAIPTTECNALVSLYYATDGDNWTDNTGWLDDTDPDNWYGVNVSGGHVYQIHLNNNGLNGTIPTSIGNFPNLIELFMRQNQLSGTIPPEIGNLSSLTGLQLQTNDLTGSIPVELADATNFYSINLNSNDLTGTIPSALGTLSNLNRLDVSMNQLSGSIPIELGELSNLTYLYLQNNDFSGQIPDEFTALTVDYFYYYGTPLCEPQNYTFQTWISSVSYYSGSGIDCPAVASPIAPYGNSSFPDAIFTWLKDEGATEYRFYLNDVSGNMINTWLSEASVCGATTCSYDPGLHLSVGNYSWATQTRSSTVTGPWSDYAAFIIGTKPISPTGRIYDVRPDYTWEEWLSADDYRLFVSHAAVGTVINEWYEATDICAAGYCTARSDVHLQTGNHSYTFQARSDDLVINDWSTYLSFKLLNASPPSDSIVPISPTGAEITTVNPTYSWNEVNHASWYKVFVGSQTTGKVYNAYHRAAEACYGTLCQITPTEYLISGSPASVLEYDTILNWYVMPVNVAGNGSWSGAQNFRTEEP